MKMTKALQCLACDGVRGCFLQQPRCVCRGSQKLKMINQISIVKVGPLAPPSHRGDGVFIPRSSYFFVDLLGFNESVFPGVSLLSRRR